MKRVCCAIGIFSPPIAALAVLVAGFLTPGYDPLARTVSRLALADMPAAVAADAAIALAGLSCIALALAVDHHAGVGRTALAVAGAAFVLAAFVHLNPGSGGATWLHRGASGLAVLALTVAPLSLWRVYGRLLLFLGMADVATLVIAAVLVPTSFTAWGAWERVMLALALTGVVILAVRIRTKELTSPSIEDTANARSAVQSRAGT